MVGTISIIFCRLSITFHPVASGTRRGGTEIALLHQLTVRSGENTYAVVNEAGQASPVVSRADAPRFWTGLSQRAGPFS